MTTISLPHQGSLTDLPLTEVLAQLLGGGATGMLEVVRGQVRRTVGISRGVIVSLGSNALSDSFARLVESAGRIDAAAAGELRKQAHQAGVGQDEYALAQGLLSPEEVARFRRLQGQVRLISLLSSPDGSYVWAPDSQIAATRESDGLAVGQIVLQCLRRRGELGPLRVALARRGTQRPSLRASVESMGLSPEERSLAALIDGTRTVRELTGASPLPAEATTTLLYSLFVSGMVAVDEGAPAPALPPSAAAVMAPPPPAVMAPPPPAVMAPPPPAVMAPPPPSPARPAPPPAVMAAPPPAVMAAPPPAVMAAPSPAVMAAPPPAVMTSAAAAMPAARPGGGIDDLISEEVGELKGPVPVIKKNLSDKPALNFSMAGFTDAQIQIATRFKEDLVRMSAQNYFELLGVDRQVGTADIRKAYFAKVKDYHADRLVGQPAAVQSLGNELFTLLQAAYETLTDPARRESYVAATFYGKVTDEEEAAVAKVQAVLQADVHYKRGIGLLNAGNIKGAVVALQKALEIYPREPEYRAALGFAQFRLNFPANEKACEEAERMIVEATKENPKLDKGFLYLGRIHLARQDPETARKWFIKAARANEKNLEAIRELQALADWQPEEESTGIFSSFLARFKK